jgi:putative peptide zinc metalloprotease protein
MRQTAQTNRFSLRALGYGPGVKNTGAGPDARPAVAEEQVAGGTAVAMSSRRPALERAEGIELIGEYEGSGFKEAPSLVRRPDGQVIQLPPLLYEVASRADGSKTSDEIAKDISAAINRGLSGDDVEFLAKEKLRPLGILCAPDGTSPEFEKPDPFLAFKFRVGVISEKTSGALGSAFKVLFFPVIVLAALAGLVVADWWLFAVHGVAQSLRQALYHPGWFLPLFAAVVLAAAFHEIGHAAGCRYGGGHPGRMGCGLYLAWPAFYTDVTDTYRLSRRDRLRTDLGGVYFNVLIILGVTGLYLATHVEALLLIVLIQHLEIVHQLLPIVRLDGYYIVSDLTGVPDLFARIGPILRSLVPGRKADDQVKVLKRWVRVAVTLWVLVVVPLLLFEMLVILIHLPRILGTAWDSAAKLAHGVSHGFATGHAFTAVTDILQLAVLAIPVLGILLMLWKFGSQIVRWTITKTEGRPVLRSGAALIGAGALVLLAMAWIPKHSYRPIQRQERGTVADGLTDVRHIRSVGPAYTATKQAPASTATSASTPASSGSTTPTTAVSSTGSVTPTTAANGSSSATTSTTVRSTTTTVPDATTTTVP